MLQNIILYVTSTAAQVWAALMIFEIIVMRDVKEKSNSEISRLRNNDVSLVSWATVVGQIEEFRKARQEHSVFGLDETTLITWNIDLGSYIRVVSAASANKIYLATDVPSSFVFPRDLDLQERVDQTWLRIRHLSKRVSQPRHAFVLGGVSIAFNLVMIAAASIPEQCRTVLWLVIAGTILANLIVGFLVGRRAFEALES